MRTVAIYIRVSTQEQAQEGYSIGEQRERLTAYCKAHDWHIYNTYVDGGFTGSNTNRPALQRLLTELEHIDIVLVYKLDRLSRSQKDMLQLIEDHLLPSDTNFVSMTESFDTSTPFGRAMIGILSVFAQLEREQIRERTMLGKAARARDGYFHGGHPPIGYQYVDGQLIVDPYEGMQVRQIFDWYLDGYGITRITEMLVEKGFTNKYGSWANISTVANLLKSQIYTGRITYGGVTEKCLHEALIDDDTFSRVQRIREQRRATYTSGRRNDAGALLTGLLFCGNCGARYRFRQETKGGRTYTYYSCYSRTASRQNMGKDKSCRNRSWQAATLDDRVTDEIMRLALDPKAQEEIIMREKAKRTANATSDHETLQTKILDIDDRMNRLMDLYERDGIPSEMLSQRITSLHSEKQALQNILSEQPAAEVPSLDGLQRSFDVIADVWEEATTIERRDLLASIVHRITLHEADIEFTWLAL